MIMLQRALLFLVAAILGLALFGSRIEAAPPGSGRIAFISDRGGKHRIYSMNADGSNINVLIDPPGNLGHSERFTFSRDGRKITFVSHTSAECCQIYVANIDGSNLTRVTNVPGEYSGPAMSPDGRRIAFTTNRGLYYQQIFVVNLDGWSLDRLTNLRGDSSYPAFSPDGRKIAFVSGPAPAISRPKGSASWGIYSMNADGSNITRLTNTPEANYLAFSPPVFSPDGRTIVFVFGRQTIYMMNADGSSVTPLNPSPMVINTGASFGPDGRMIAFSCGESVCVMNADGSNIIVLTDGWSPAFIP